MVWPIRGRRREPRKHAFEAALEEARLDPESNEPLSDGPGPLGPGVGSLGGIAVAEGYVAPASLVRAYGGEGEADGARPKDRPQEAALKLKAVLAKGGHTPRDLAKLRRSFAARHHPDRVPDDMRSEAVAAMAEINAEIDRALKRANA
ncbi:hypothetical protein [Hyphomicrobium sp.]|uniref:hypothetical protein n=1 Tax=Hyphomicrobium sp. TaxID=82 RepID=UPI002FDCFA18